MKRDRMLRPHYSLFMVTSPEIVSNDFISTDVGEKKILLKDIKTENSWNIVRTRANADTETSFALSIYSSDNFKSIVIYVLHLEQND